MPVQFQVQFNWQNQGFSELYYTADANLNTAKQESDFLVSERIKIMPKDPTFYIWAVRWSLIGVPGQEDIKRYSTSGVYNPPGTEQAASPWDAWLYYSKTGNGPKKVQEIRGIPTSLTGIMGNVPVPGNSYWLKQLAKFRANISGNPGNFGIFHNVVPALNVMANVISIVPSTGAMGQPPAGTLIVTVDQRLVTAANSPAKVVFRTVRCQPKLASRHVGIFLSDFSFYLKNTNEGQINYQGGGKAYIYSPTVLAAPIIDNIRSSIRKVGRPWGIMKARRPHTV